MNRPQAFANKTVMIRAFVHPTMHGTYLRQHGCDTSLLLVLPEEIAGYTGPVKTVEDDAFARFLNARYNYRPEAPVFEASFFGVIEAAAGGRGFGYYRNHTSRFVLQSVGLEPDLDKQIVTIWDPPMTGKRPSILRRLWNRIAK